MTSVTPGGVAPNGGIAMSLPMKDSLPEGMIDSIPIELILNIFRFLPPEKLKGSIPVVCKLWNQLSRDLIFWKDLVRREFGETIPPTVNCTEFYMRGVGFNRFLQTGNYLISPKKPTIPKNHIVFEDEAHTSQLIYLEGAKILKWDPILQKTPQTLYIHQGLNEELKLWQVTFVNINPQKQHPYVLCTAKSASVTELLLININNGNCEYCLPITNYPVVNAIFPFEHSQTNYLLIAHGDQCDIWDLHQRQFLHTLSSIVDVDFYGRPILRIFQSKQGRPLMVASTYTGPGDHRVDVLDLISNQLVAILVQNALGKIKQTIVKDHKTNDVFIVLAPDYARTGLRVWNTTNWQEENPLSLEIYISTHKVDSITCGDKDLIVVNTGISDIPGTSYSGFVFDFSDRVQIIQSPGSIYDEAFSFQIKYRYLFLGKPHAFDIYDISSSNRDPITQLIPSQKQVKLPFYPKKFDFFRFGQKLGVPYLIFCSYKSSADQYATTVIDLGSLTPSTPYEIEKYKFESLKANLREWVTLTNAQPHNQPSSGPNGKKLWSLFKVFLAFVFLGTAFRFIQKYIRTRHSVG